MNLRSISHDVSDNPAGFPTDQNHGFSLLESPMTCGRKTFFPQRWLSFSGYNPSLWVGQPKAVRMVNDDIYRRINATILDLISASWTCVRVPIFWLLGSVRFSVIVRLCSWIVSRRSERISNTSPCRSRSSTSAASVSLYRSRWSGVNDEGSRSSVSSGLSSSTRDSEPKCGNICCWVICQWRRAFPSIARSWSRSWSVAWEILALKNWSSICHSQGGA